MVCRPPYVRCQGRKRLRCWLFLRPCIPTCLPPCLYAPPTRTAWIMAFAHTGFGSTAPQHIARLTRDLASHACGVHDVAYSAIVDTLRVFAHYTAPHTTHWRRFRCRLWFAFCRTPLRRTVFDHYLFTYRCYLSPYLPLPSLALPHAPATTCLFAPCCRTRHRLRTRSPGSCSCLTPRTPPHPRYLPHTHTATYAACCAPYTPTYPCPPLPRASLRLNTCLVAFLSMTNASPPPPPWLVH